MIHEYFDIQLKRLNRYIVEFGLHPVLGYILGLLLFIGLSKYIFYKAPYAIYIYLLIAIYILFMIKTKKRSDFLKIIFPIKEFRRIRIIENILVMLPFTFYLLYEWEPFAAACSISLIIVIAFLPRGMSITRSIPTPFSFQPFEFSIGIRSNYILYFALYFILFMAIRVGNFNLGIATLIASFLLSFTFYTSLEEQSYIWNYKDAANGFLKNKIVTALAHLTLLSAPILLILLFVWLDQSVYIIGIQAIGYIYLITIILAKYSAYPRAMSLPQGLILLFSLWVPPLLLFIIPYLYRKSAVSLKSILS